MDLAVGARQTWVMMDLRTKGGQSKLLKQCTYPLTGLACVKRVYTDLATFHITSRGVVCTSTAEGVSLSAVEDMLSFPLVDAAA